MRILVLGLGAALIAGSAVPGSAEDPPAAECSPCGGLVLSHTLPQATPREPGTSSPPSSVRLRIDMQDKALLKPMTRAEIKRLVVALSAAATKGGQSPAKAGTDGQGLTWERTAVITHDVLTLLAGVHMRESLAAYQKTPKPDQAVVDFNLSAQKTLDVCARGRYREFGGDPAYQQSLQIVLENRQLLEKLMLEPLLPSRNPRAGHPSGHSK
jgi:hypothetical protein